MKKRIDMKNKKILVVDGQGGGIGKAIIEKIKKESLPITIIATGTNSIASTAMLKAGADDVATGENAVIFNARNCDYILGPVGIISANSMLGEISPAMAEAIDSSPATKLLIPVNKCNIYIAGVEDNGLSSKIEDLIAKLRDIT